LQIKVASRLSGVATASLGKFDKRLAGEKAGERAPLGKRRHFLPVTDTNTERGKVCDAKEPPSFTASRLLCTKIVVPSRVAFGI
jgi:hypothetical protein